MAIQWTPDLAVGIEAIDHQHQELFASAAKLVDALRQGRGRTEALQCLDFLERYVQQHFALEQQAMAASLYPGREEHLSQHRQLTEQTRLLRQAFDSHGTSPLVVADLCEQLCAWLAEHIGRIDKKLAAWLKQHPVDPSRLGLLGKG